MRGVLHGGLRSGVVTAMVAALLVVGARPAAAATPPANDAFAKAQPISGMKGVVYGTLAGATIENSPTSCMEPQKMYGWGDRHSVWFRWTAPTNGWLRFDVRPYGGWDGYVDAFRYRGHCMSRDAAATAASNEPGSYGQLEVTRGESIWLGVYSFAPEDVGTFAVTWRAIPRPPPLNDRFADADVVWGRYGTAWRTTVNATRESGEPAHAGRAGGRSAWFRWTAPLSGPAMFHAGSGPQWDCLLAVYTGSSVGALTPVGSDASTAPSNSCTARFTATAGTTYRIALDGERGEEASFLLTWNSGPPPPHDAIGSARVITGGDGVLNDNNRGATTEPGDPRDAETRSGSSVWYRWTAPNDGYVTFDVHSPPLYQPSSPFEYDKRVAVFTGSPGALTLVEASEAPPGESLLAYFPAERGTTYWIQVTGTHEQVVHYMLTWQLWHAGNDGFANAITLPPTGSVAFDTTGATAEPGEPAHGVHDHPARRSLWFDWTAPQSGTVTFDDYEAPDGYFEQLALSAYTGSSVGALARVPVTREQVTSAWARWRFAATAGTTYRIAVDEDSYWGHGQRHRLNWYYGERNFIAPVVALTAPADGTVVGGKVTVSATASDADGVWSAGYSHDIAATFHKGPEPEPAPYDIVFDTEAYRDGPITTTATAWDRQANLGTSPERTLVIENRPPAASRLGSSDQLTTDTSAYVKWEADEPLSRARCSLDGAPYTDCQTYPGTPHGEQVWAGLSEGLHVFRILVTDMQGRESVDADTYWWIVDTKGVGVVAPSDTVAPTATAPLPDILGGHPVGNTTAPVRLSWTSRDATTGVQRHDMQVSVNGGAWQAMPAFANLDRAIYDLAAGRSYRFRVRAWDWAGNVSGWAYGPRFSVGLAQEHTGWSYSAGWKRVAMSGASGGYVARTGTKGAAARYSFTGKSIALYGPKLPSLGKSAIYLDGVRVATLNQWDPHGESRAALFVRNGLDPRVRHVLEVRSLGTPGYSPGGGTGVVVDVATRLV